MRLPRMPAQAAIEQGGVIRPGGGPASDLPRQPRPRPTPAAGSRVGQRMPPGEPLEQGEPEEVALTLVDADGEVVMQRVAERMPHEEGATAMHPQRIECRIAHAAARHGLRHDRLQLTCRARVDRRGRPQGDRITRLDRGGDSGEPALDELSRRNRPAPGMTVPGVRDRVSEHEPQRAPRLRRERHATTVESVPDDGHPIAIGARRKQIGGVDLETLELERRIVRVLQWMNLVGAEPEGRRVAIGQPSQHDRRPAIEIRENLHETAVRRPGDEHLRARQSQAVAVARERRTDGAEVTAGIGLGATEDRKWASRGVKLPPADVERVLAEDEVVAQVCVVGDGLPWPVALVVPEPAVLRATMSRLGVRVLSRRAALTHPRVLAWIGRRLASRQARLPKAWQVRRVILVGRAFDAAHGEATESLKLKRAEIARHFRTQVEAAAADESALGVGMVPGGSNAAAVSAGAVSLPAGGVVTALWHGGDGGFTASANTASRPLSAGVVGVLERSCATLAHLRAHGRLYEPLGEAGSVPPLADAPPPRVGRFSRDAEDALGEAGLWGLFVPTANGGTGATVAELARAITMLAADCPTAAGMLAVHSAIGAVSALVAFGTPAQQATRAAHVARWRPTC